jgi:DNA-binding transcriptional MerR regulator
VCHLTFEGMEEQEHTYSISVAARKLGLSAEWLRKGEERGSIPRARRDRNGHRYYTREDLNKLRNRRLRANE